MNGDAQMNIGALRLLAGDTQVLEEFRVEAFDVDHGGNSVHETEAEGPRSRTI